jgi:hypothetical protein
LVSALARTYGGSDPWERVEDYQRWLEYSADHPQKGSSAVAGVGCATARAFDEYSDAVYLPQPSLGLYVLLFTLALGVFWEVLAFGARVAATALGTQPVPFQYGIEDTLLDLVFDIAGAALVALFGSGLLGPVVDSIAARLERTTEGR